jgi:SAM-dependent methyltransferase
MSNRLEKVRSAFDAQRVQRFERHVDERVRQVGDLVSGQAPRNVVDLGCGDGRIGAQFLGPDTGVTFVDIAEAMLIRARRAVPPGLAGNAIFIQGDFVETLRGRTFDLVLAVGLVAHLPSVAGGLSAIAHLVQPGGRLVVQITDGATLVGRLEHWLARIRQARRGYALNWVTRDLVARELARHGLRLIDERRYFETYAVSRTGAAHTSAGFLRQLASSIGGERLLLFGTD